MRTSIRKRGARRVGVGRTTIHTVSAKKKLESSRSTTSLAPHVGIKEQFLQSNRSCASLKPYGEGGTVILNRLAERIAIPEDFIMRPEESAMQAHVKPNLLKQTEPLHCESTVSFDTCRCR